MLVLAMRENHLRYSLNNYKNVYASEFQMLLKLILHADHPVMKTLRGIAQQWDWRERVYVDSCGGDVVLPDGPSQAVLIITD